MTSPHPNASGWLAWHVHVPADGSGTDRISPLVRENLPALITPLREAGLLRRWFFIRYWEGGPHLRIRLLPQAGAQPAELDAAVRRAFAGLPSDGHAPQEYLRSIGDLAAASTASDPTVDQRRAGTVLAPGVHPAVYEPETARYGSGTALEASEAAFTVSSELALRAAGSPLDGLRLRLLGVEVLLKAAVLSAPDPSAGDPVVRQLRRHADFWRRWSASAPREVFPSGELARQAARWADVLAGQGGVSARALAERSSAVSPWLESLTALLPLGVASLGDDAETGLLLSHTHMTLNRLGIFVHDEFILAEAALRLWAASGEAGGGE
ncbi:thiopeptide-type bacteriocin biosynthesis protein [Streptomyces sp. NBC_00190]|uniref:thiopeptide-type bacteriocin biosynthesis protein n=1 Tax=Streptomyces sp. NBC_00190 TaxID=2903634 RepID=UPI002E2B1DBE|nr:thiopeptide-type bacteriocin biosynthesis protein [Streptomyces sp. NBC_00190]